jgi:ABC-type multidrug transport system ATPase subunit
MCSSTYFTGPLALLVALFAKSADTVVVAVPTLVFITLLPGLLYFELAFDVQRSVSLELALCLLPPSAAALILRTLCGYEALNAGASWDTRAAVSGCPMYAYIVMMVIDLGLYGALALRCASRQDIRSKQDASVQAVSRQSEGWFATLFNQRGNTRSDRSSPGSLLALSEADVEHQGLLEAQSPTPHSPGERRVTLKVRHLTKKYALDATEVVVLSDINANLYENRVTVLLGSNGAGKTTFMRVLAGLDGGYEGRVSLTGKVLDLSNGATAVAAKRQVGWCPQNDALFEQLTVLEHLQLVSSIVSNTDCPQFTRLLPAPVWAAVRRISCWGTASAQRSQRSQRRRLQEEQLTAALTKLDMLRHCHKRVCELSGGMKRRLSLCLAFMGDPAVLLLDEPTSGCDAHTRDLVRQDILSRRGGSAILISTHHTDDVDVLADRVWFLSERYLEVDEAVENLAAWRSKELKRRLAASSLSNASDDSQYSSESLTGLLSIEAGNVVAAGYSGSHAMEFSTHDARVKSAFIAMVGTTRAASWLDAASSRFESTESSGGVAGGARTGGVLTPGVTRHGTATRSAPSTGTELGRPAPASDLSSASGQCTSWIVPVDALPLLRKLLSQLEQSGLHSWSINTCSTYSMLCHLYDHPGAAQGPGSPQSDCTGTEMVSRHTREHPPARQVRSSLAMFLQHCYAVAWMRCHELQHSLRAYVFAQLVLPFLVVFTVAWSCGDVVYPKTELTSQEIGGVGELVASQGMGRENERRGPVRGDISADVPERATSSRRLSAAGAAVGEVSELAVAGRGDPAEQQLIDANSNSYSTDALQAQLEVLFGEESVLWAGDMGSDAMWQHLFDTYYSHARPRWAAFVVDDLVQRWVESTVVLDQGALRVDMATLQDAVRAVQESVCNSTAFMDSVDTKNSYSNDNNAGGIIGSNTSALLRGQADFCGGLPALRIDFLNSTAQYGNGSISITSYESVRSNVTLLSNVTTDHAAPIFLKEVVPAVYTALQHSSSLNASTEYNNSGTPYAASYRLYSHPLPLANESSEVYLQRGYVGSTVVLLYSLLTTVACVRSVIAQRRNGTKTQLHLAGVYPLPFWLGNYLVDAVLCSLTLGAIAIGIVAGGAPISEYFLDFPPAPGVLLALCLVSFAAAAVASSYALSVLSQDALSSQMLLLVCAIANGMFVKLFLDRHTGQPAYRPVIQLLLHVSPAFTFSTAIGDLIAMHALEVSARAQGKAGPSPQHLLRSVYHCVVIMLVQAAVYLALCVAVDCYWQRLSAVIGKWRWSTPQLQGDQPITDGTAASDHLLGQEGVGEEEQSYRGGQGRTDSIEDALVEAREVVVQYLRHHKLALKGATFTIAQGERVALLGMNGGGKSTLFRTLALAENAPVSGGVAITGLDSVREMWRLCGRRAVGYVPQEGGLFEFLTVEQTLHLYQMLCGSHGRDAASSDGDIIPERYGAYPVHTLSGGTRKKLAVRVANTAQPSLLLLDECTTGVDPVAAERIVRYLKHDLRAGTQGILFASHRVDESLAVCDRVLLLNEGRVVLDEPITALHDLAHRFYHVDIALPDLHRRQVRRAGIGIDRPPAPQRGGGLRNYGSIEEPAEAERGAEQAAMEALERALADLQQTLGAAERVVKYTPALVRVTWARSVAPLSPAWALLATWQEVGRIKGYAFRSAAMEEVLEGARPVH